MSTAIALHDMGNRTGEHANGMRHRTTPTSVTVVDQDRWVDTPHDTGSLALPIDSQPFMPTHTYWITPHSTFAKNITILDLTKDIAAPYKGLTDEYKAEVKKTLKDHSFTPMLTCHRTSWLGLKYDITNDQNDHVAEWSHPWTSVGEAVLKFPDDSPHCPHPVSLRNKRWGLRTEGFTVNSQPFFWEMDSMWHSTNMTLYKVFGTGTNERKIEVAKYAQKWWGGFVTGGTVVVDSKQLDGIIACLTLAVVLKKKRQRAAERHNGGE